MSIFKAYDVRGIVPSELNVEMARQIGQVFANFIVEEVRQKRGDQAPQRVRVAVGRDARPSGDELCPALIDGLKTGGVDVVYIGQATTPMLYFAVGSLKLDGGVMATASHNPPQYNGFKFTREDAIPISKDTGIAEFERRIAANELRAAETPGTQTDHAIASEYEAFALSFARATSAKRLKVAIDTANGMAGLYPSIFDKLEIDVVPLFFDIDCTFPNHEANPIKLDTLDALRKAVREQQCDLGIAFDGDADRCVAIDETGELVRADIATGLIAQDMLEKNPGAAVLYDLRSSRIVPEIIAKKGGRPIRVRVGHSFAKAVMREERAIFGGELSGHAYWQAAYQADSAILTMIELLNLLRETGKKLSELVAPLMVYHSTGEINFEVVDKDGTMKALEAKYGPTGLGGQVDWLDGITVNFSDWWFNVRPSNTEPLLRLTMECVNKADVAPRLAELQAMLGTPVH